nr:transcriptional regulator, SARP family [Kibdelosporangium sp. MJ126-NF4]
MAVHWAHRVQHRFPDGTLYINLRGYGPDEPATPGDVLGVFLGALGMLPERIPVDLDARMGLYRSVLAGRRVLIVLDNANSPTQVRPLLPGGAGCAVVVTSRADLTGLVISDGATRITVDLMTEREALELVRATVGSHRADAQPEAVAGLVRACARLPLALRIAAGRAAAQPHLTIADLVSEMDSEQGRWEALSADEHTAVRAVFDWSYQRLTSAQARMLRRLGLHPGSEFSVHAAAAVAGVDVATARRLLGALAEGHLIEPIVRDRYRFHDLLHAYAADRADRDDIPTERDQARHVLLEWYAHHVKKAYGTIAPRLFDWLAGAGLDTRACPEIHFSGPAEAWAWVDAELVTMAASVRAAARHGLPRFTVVLASATLAAVSLQGLWDDVFDICDIGMAAARRAGDLTAECQLQVSLACALQCVGRWHEAIDCLRAAAALAHDLGDPGLQAAALSHLGWMCVEQERYADAREHFRSALPLSVGVQNGYLHGFIEYSLGAVETDLDFPDVPSGHTDDVHRAVSCWRVALETFDRTTDPRTAELRTRIFALAEVRRLNGLLSPVGQG